jgi:hypothetical protein
MTREDWMPWVPPAFVLGITGAVMLPVLIRATLHRRRRVGALAGLADHLGFRFRRGPDERGVKELPGFEGNFIWPPLEALNTIEGPVRIEGRRFDARLGDCMSTLNRRLSGSDPLSDAMEDPKQSCSYAAVRLPTTVVPDVEITPRNRRTTVALPMGLALEEVRLELEAFNRAYLVLSTQPRFAYDILHPRTVELLLQSASPSRVVVGRGWCMAMSMEGPWSAGELEAALRFVGSFVALWPEHVMKDLEAMAPRPTGKHRRA